MGPQLDPVAGDDRLPDRCAIVVVGGGIVGVSAVLTLAERGIAVALCEKGQIAGEQSSRNWGWVRKNGRDEREIPLIIESLRMWEGMNAKIGAETGYRRSGVLHVATTETAAKHQAKWLERARPYQIGSRLVEGAELAQLLPGATRCYASGLYNPTDGRAEPHKATPAIALAARTLGAAILTGCAVRGLDVVRRAGRGRRHGERPHRLRRRYSRGRRLVQAVLRSPRPALASAQGARERAANRANRGAAGDKRLARRLRPSQKARRRLHDRQWRRQHRAGRAGYVPLLP